MCFPMRSNTSRWEKAHGVAAGGAGAAVGASGCGRWRREWLGLRLGSRGRRWSIDRRRCALDIHTHKHAPPVSPLAPTLPLVEAEREPLAPAALRRAACCSRARSRSIALQGVIMDGLLMH